MNKWEYFAKSIELDYYSYRAWLIMVYGILVEESKSTEGFTLYVENKKLMGDTGTGPVAINGYEFGKPLYDVDEQVTVPAGFMGFVEGETKTTYGCLIANILLFYEPYRGKVKYQNTVITPGLANHIAYEMLRTDKATVEEHIRYENYSAYIQCLSRPVCVGATRKMITPPVAVIALRDKLFAETNGVITDPAQWAGIQDQLSVAYKDYLKDDKSARFLYPKGAIPSQLMRCFVTYGSEPDFYDETKVMVMKESLVDGWDPKFMPVIVNVARAGSYNRGVATAMGGAAVKEVNRIFQNYSIVPEDCSAKHGLLITLDSTNALKYIGRYRVGDPTPLTESLLNGSVGKTMVIRSPGFCLAKRPTRCMYCMGDNVSNSGERIGGQMTSMFSAYMLTYMKMMHTTTLSVNRLNVDRSFL